MGLFKPAWKSKDWTKAVKAIEKVTDKNKLARIAVEAPTSDARVAAISKINDQTVLTNIAKNDENEWVRETAVEKLTDQIVLAYVAKNEEETSKVRSVAIKKLTDQTVLTDIAKNDKWLRVEAIRKLTNQTVLANIAKNDKGQRERTEAVEKLTDQTILTEIAKTENDAWVIRTLMKMGKLINRDLLSDVLENAKAQEARWCACELLNKNHSWKGCCCVICDYAGNHSWKWTGRTDIDQFHWTDHYTCSKCGKKEDINQRYETGDYDYPYMKNYEHYL